MTGREIYNINQQYFADKGLISPHYRNFKKSSRKDQKFEKIGQETCSVYQKRYKQMKICSTSIMIREREIITSLGCYFTLIGLAEIQKLDSILLVGL